MGKILSDLQKLASETTWQERRRAHFRALRST
jgi:hypothetical protein